MKTRFRGIKKPVTTIFRSVLILELVLFFIVSLQGNLQAQCSGGTLAGNLTITASWQTVSCNTYTYYTFDAYAGQSIIFTFCQGGGSTSIDTQLEVHNNTGTSIGFYNDDNCGTGSEVVFSAPANGTYRISIYRFNCQTTSVSAGTLAYQTVLPNNQDCVGAISVCQPTYTQNQSFFGHGAILDYTSSNNCPGICVDEEDLSVWYTFQVQTSGVLDFRITPNDPNSDYDWMLVNLTNHDCSVIPNLDSYSSLVTSCNAAYDYGTTGMNNLTPNTGDNCQGPSSLGEYPINNPTANVTAGQIYYLNIQNWSATQGGYTLDFSHSTATIFDNNPPIPDLFVQPVCNGSTFTVLFNENVDCSTINASDFTISGPGGPYVITDLIGAACAIGGIMEREFVITFSPAISVSGNFTINYNGNAEDMCGNIASPDSWTVTINSGASMTLTSAASTLNQTICNGNAITNITWSSTGGTNCTFSGLPTGVTGNYNSGTGAITISGTPTANGTFNFTVSLTGSCGAATATGTITVSSNITATFNSYGPYCVGQSAPALPTTSTNGVTGSWSPAAINTNTAGTFNFTFTPNSGQCSAPITISVVVNNGTVATFDNFGPYCLGSTPEILPTISNNSVNGNWSPATINTMVEGPTTYTFTPSSGACNVPVEIYILIVPLPTVLADLTTPLNCNGTGGVVTVSASGGQVPYSGIGTYNVVAGSFSYLVTDNLGCKSTASVVVVAPDPLLADIEKINDVECFGRSTGRIAIEVTQGTPPYNVSWYSHSQHSTSGLVEADNLRAGDYYISVSDAVGCTFSQHINILEPSRIEAYVFSEGPSCIGNTDGRMDVSISGGTAPYMIIWNDIGLDTTALGDLDNGRYRLIIRDANNCLVDLGEISLNDNPVDCLQIPNAFTPNADGINDTWEIQNIELFPEAEARIYNRWGQVVYYDSPLNNPWDGYYNNKRLPAGTYIYVLQTYRGIDDYVGVVTIMH